MVPGMALGTEVWGYLATLATIVLAPRTKPHRRLLMAVPAGWL